MPRKAPPTISGRTSKRAGNNDTTTVVVADGYAVYFDGQQHPGGTKLTVPTDAAAQWIGRSWATPAK